MKKIWSNLTLLSFTLPLFSITEMKNEVTAPILTPSLSEQKTLKMRLDNGLEAIIISDPNTDKSGAVLTVKVGSWEDPIEYPGLAHFLEHMLFMGTKKYPDEGEYQRYIQDNSGQTNAFTANHITSYLFSINNNSFEEGLNRFSQFFKEPLFNPSGVSRELCAIDQEYEMNVQKSSVREYFVYKAISDPSHPLWRFNIGNSKTLKDVRRNELIDWYKQHYSANLMRLLVISPEPLDQLKEIVIKDFSDIQNNNKKAFTIPQRYTQPSMQGRMVVIEPIKDTRSLSIAWELPLEFVMMKEIKPEIIVCHILGHEGEESLLAQLKREGLADAISCGPLNSGAINRDLFIHVTLTDKGLHEVNTVIQRVFQTINLFKQNGYSEQLFEEIHKIEKLSYQYQPRQNIFETLMTHGINIHNENIETYPEQTQIIQKYDSKSVLDLLNFLTPENAIFFLTAPKGTTNYIPNKTEPWLGVAYSIEKIDPSLLEEWKNASPHSNITLPPSNPFLPDSLTLFENKKENQSQKITTTLIPKPETLVDDNNIKIYYCLDEKFHEPKIYLSLEIKTPEVNPGDPLKTVMADLYVKFLTDNLKKYSYPAEIAGLSYQIKQQNNGIGIRIFGFNDKAERLLTTILESMKKIVIHPETFKSNKQMLSRKYQNFAKESPLNLSIEILKNIINKQYSTHKEKAQTIRGLSIKKFQTYSNDLFKKTYTQGLLYGNIPKDNALQIVNTLKMTFNLENYPKDEQLRKEIIDLPNTSRPFYIENNAGVPGNAALLAIEFTPFSLKARSTQQILMQGMQEPFFSELRTKQQTGYAVSNMGQDVERHLFNLFLVQSVTNDPRDLLARFELFIETFLQNMENDGLTEERFKQIQAAMIKNLEVPANSLEEMGSLLETLAFEFNGDFLWMEKRIESLKNLTYQEFLTISKEMLGKGNRKRIGCLIKGIQIEDKVLDYRRITNLNEIKKFSNYTSLENIPTPTIAPITPIQEDSLSLK